MKAAEVINDLRRRFPHEPEYLQAVEEVVTTIEDVFLFCCLFRAAPMAYESS